MLDVIRNRDVAAEMLERDESFLLAVLLCLENHRCCKRIFRHLCGEDSCHGFFVSVRGKLLNRKIDGAVCERPHIRSVERLLLCDDSDFLVLRRISDMRDEIEKHFVLFHLSIDFRNGKTDEIRNFHSLISVALADDEL